MDETITFTKAELLDAAVARIADKSRGDSPDGANDHEVVIDLYKASLAQVEKSGGKINVFAGWREAIRFDPKLGKRVLDYCFDNGDGK